MVMYSYLVFKQGKGIMRTYWLRGERDTDNQQTGAAAHHHQANLPSISLSDTEGEPLPSPIPVNIQESTPSPMSPISDLGQDVGAAIAGQNQPSTNPPHINSNKPPSYFEATSQEQQPLTSDTVPLRAATAAAMSCVNEVIRRDLYWTVLLLCYSCSRLDNIND